MIDRPSDATEKARNEAEQFRQRAEEAREVREQLRITAEAERTAGEEARGQAEAGRDAVVAEVRATAEILNTSLEQMKVVEEMRRMLTDIRDATKLDPN